VDHLANLSRGVDDEDTGGGHAGREVCCLVVRVVAEAGVKRVVRLRNKRKLGSR